MNKEKPQSRLNIVVALAVEARPLIDYYHLQKINTKTCLSIYANQDASIYLIVSGVGKINAALATAYLHAFANTNEQACLLNLGIAGSDQHALGEVLIAESIVDKASSKAAYPYLGLFSKRSSYPLITVEQAQTAYPVGAMIDMEASGFFQAATKLVTHEQVQVLKIISDNPQYPATLINKKQVTQLISEKINEINTVVQSLLDFSGEENQQQFKCQYFEQFIQQWHFSQYQQHQLRELLRRWQINKPDVNPLEQIKSVDSAKQIIESLSQNHSEIAS